MKNLQVKKQINNKLKLYKHSIISSTVLTIIGAAGIACGETYVSNRLFDNGSSIEKYLFVFGFPLVFIPLFNLNYANVILNYSPEEIQLLKTIKKELKKGINRFENIKEENFETAFEKEKNKSIGSKVK